MNIYVLLLILASIALSALAQITLKSGMSQPFIQHALTSGGLPMVWAVATNLHVIGGLALYGLGAILWLGVLAKVDVSLAYPFVAFGFILTMILAVLLLGESVSYVRLIGTLLITVGAILISRT